MDLSLGANLSLTVNPLYKRTGGSGYPLSFLYDPGPESPYQYLNEPSRLRAHSLELPLIRRDHFGSAGSRRWRPFLGSGFAFQTAWQTVEDGYVTRTRESGELSFSRYKTERRTSTDVGAIASAGRA